MGAKPVIQNFDLTVYLRIGNKFFRPLSKAAGNDEISQNFARKI